MLEAGTQRGLMPKIPAQADHDRLPVLAMKCAQQVRCRVTAAVIDEDNLEIGADRFERRAKSLPEQLDVLLLVIDRHNNRNQGHSRSERTREKWGPGYTDPSVMKVLGTLSNCNVLYQNCVSA